MKCAILQLYVLGKKKHSQTVLTRMLMICGSLKKTRSTTFWTSLKLRSSMGQFKLINRFPHYSTQTSPT